MLLFSKIPRFTKQTRHVQPVNDIDLCLRMEQLSLNVTQRTPPVIFSTRFFHTTTSLQKDKHHLTSKGLIKECYLERRRQFLDRHGFLKNKTLFQGHVVYENKHLYHHDHIDKFGATNLERMSRGFSPLIIGGDDYLTIHHFDQTHDGDWVVLPNNFHNQNDLVLHSNVKVRKGVVRHVFAKERSAYWRFVANTHLEKRITFGIRKK